MDWHQFSPYELRSGPEQVQGCLARGVVPWMRLPTGSGKSLNVYVPALAK